MTYKCFIMRDFTIDRYSELLSTLSGAGYQMIAFEDYLTMKTDSRLPERFVILRHDIDLRAPLALPVAQAEKAIDARASYYFRCVLESNQPEVIKRIVELGMEVGYHYEDMTIADGDTEKALEHFKHWLNYFKQFYPVRTICMHGAPKSKFDSKALWEYADYHDFGIIGEPYFDTDFADVVYLTDTGRRWDGYKVSVRDKIPQHQERWTAAGWVYHSTKDIIKAAQDCVLPPHLMLTTHPQRWTDNILLWLYEWARQSAANMVKRLIVIKK